MTVKNGQRTTQAPNQFNGRESVNGMKQMMGGIANGPIRMTHQGNNYGQNQKVKVSTLSNQKIINLKYLF